MITGVHIFMDPLGQEPCLHFHGSIYTILKYEVQLLLLENQYLSLSIERGTVYAT